MQHFSGLVFDMKHVQRLKYRCKRETDTDPVGKSTSPQVPRQKSCMSLSLVLGPGQTGDERLALTVPGVNLGIFYINEKMYFC